MSELTDSGYPVMLEIDPPASQNRLTVLFRPILAIPHWIIIYLVGIAAFVVWLLASLSIVITGRYPEPLLRFSTGYARWATRVNAYGGALSFNEQTGIPYVGIPYITGGFLTDKYPPFTLDEVPDYPIRLHVQEQIEGRNRLTGFFPVRIIMLIPHFIVLGILSIFITIATVVAWLAGIVLGGLPEWLHNFIAGYTRWSTRVFVYAGLLVDEYPPFSFAETVPIPPQGILPQGVLSVLTIHDLTSREMLIYNQRIEQRKKGSLTTWLLWLFLGGIGGHRYYLGNIGMAIAMTLTLGGLGVWALIDAFFIPAALRKNYAEVEAGVLQEIELARGETNPSPADREASTDSSRLGSAAENLKSLADLHERGLLTDEEYEERRAREVERL